MSNAILKAIGIGAGVFLGMLLVFWIISRAAGVPFLGAPPAPPRTTATPTPVLPPFLR